MKDSIDHLHKIILQRYHAHRADHIFTVAISGIDASGKSHLSKCLEDELQREGLRVATVHLDPWQNPIPVRLRPENAAENFYHNGFRWNEFFGQLILPLKKNGHIRLTARLICAHADEYYDFDFSYEGIHLLLIEGIFLFQERFSSHYDFTIWIECSFETAMRRAINRNVERLSAAGLRRDYNTYYYPAQRYHLQTDRPLSFTHHIFHND